MGLPAGFDPLDFGICLGTATHARKQDLYIRADRTTAVVGAQGSGKSLDALLPTLLGAPGAALVTLTKLGDLLLVVDERAAPRRPGEPPRPYAVMDLFGMAPGLPQLRRDPLEGCVDYQIAERRAKAFTAGTVLGGTDRNNGNDDAARYYAAEAVKVLKAYFHATALTGRSMQHVMQWVARPKATEEAAEILKHHPHAEPLWDGQLRGALYNEDDRTSGNTISTIQQAMDPFFQSGFRQRFVPTPDEPATDVEQLIRDNGTIYLLGREDKYSSASPLMTAVGEHILDTVRRMATENAHQKLTPWFLALLDEFPSTAPMPSVTIGMANDRALGVCYLLATQNWELIELVYGREDADAILNLINNLLVFGGGKSTAFADRISSIIGEVEIPRTSTSYGAGGRSRTRDSEWVPVFRQGEIRRLPERHALLVAENIRPVIARLDRCIDGERGKRLLQQQKRAAAHIDTHRARQDTVTNRTAAAVKAARERGLTT
jgi:type IV secretion system protein VirD4